MRLKYSVANKNYEKGKIILEHSKSKVKKAGECIRKNESGQEEAIEIIQQYRAAHLYPLTIIKNLVWKHSKKISSNAVIARRLKRLPTIIDKLKRKTLDGITPNSISVTRMSDIGGCRVIVEDKKELLALNGSLDKSRTTHKTQRIRNYIDNPKPTGYRGIHRIYRCYENDESHTWKGFEVEVQLRTKLQHLWATTIEVVDLCEGKTLKTNPFENNPSWIEFFRLMSEFIADEEGFIRLTNSEKNTKKNRLIQLDDKLNAIEKLGSFNKIFSNQYIMPLIKDQGFLIISIKDGSLKCIPYELHDHELALETYSEIEKDPNSNGLFIVMDDMKKIEIAYPNYLIDTSGFIDKFNFYTSTSYWEKPYR